MTRSALSDAAIVGIGRTPFVRKSGRTTLGMAGEARARRVRATAASHRATSTASPVTPAATPASPMQVAHAIGIDDLGWCQSVMGGGNSVASVVAGAAAAVVTGQADVVVVYRVLGSGTRYGKAMDRVLAPGEGQFAAPHGYLVPPQWFAMWCRRHQHVYGSTSEDLGAIAVQQRAPRRQQPARDRPRAHHDRRLPRRAMGERAVPCLRLLLRGRRRGRARGHVGRTRRRPGAAARLPARRFRRQRSGWLGLRVGRHDVHVLARRGAAALVEDRVAAERHGRRADVRLLHVHRHGDPRRLRLLRQGRSRRLLPRGPRDVRRRRGREPARRSALRGLPARLEPPLRGGAAAAR